MAHDWQRRVDATWWEWLVVWLPVAGEETPQRALASLHFGSAGDGKGSRWRGGSPWFVSAAFALDVWWRADVLQGRAENERARESERGHKWVGRQGLGWTAKRAVTGGGDGTRRDEPGKGRWETLGPRAIQPCEMVRMHAARWFVLGPAMQAVGTGSDLALGPRCATTGSCRMQIT